MRKKWKQVILLLFFVIFLVISVLCVYLNLKSKTFIRLIEGQMPEYSRNLALRNWPKVFEIAGQMAETHWQWIGALRPRPREAVDNYYVLDATDMYCFMLYLSVWAQIRQTPPEELQKTLTSATLSVHAPAALYYAGMSDMAQKPAPGQKVYYNSMLEFARHAFGKKQGHFYTRLYIGAKQVSLEMALENKRAGYTEERSFYLNAHAQILRSDYSWLNYKDADCIVSDFYIVRKKYQEPIEHLAQDLPEFSAPLDPVGNLIINHYIKALIFSGQQDKAFKELVQLSHRKLVTLPPSEFWEIPMTEMVKEQFDATTVSMHTEKMRNSEGDKIRYRYYSMQTGHKGI